MFQVAAVGINDAYFDGLEILRNHGLTEESRAGAVKVLPQPLVTRYAAPRQRVLMDPVRDANPFFHLFEALWLLAGRNDARWLDQFVHDFSSRFAEDDGIMHGSYGFRWRHHFDLDGGGALDPAEGMDQLDYVVKLLKANPRDRRVVIQMWDPVSDLGVDKRDLPCNVTALPRISPYGLDLTVFCRSNDAVWGAYGANVVQFSILQEYLAARIGRPIGMYYQFSNNFHVYLDQLEKLPRGVRPINPYLDMKETVIVSDPVTFDGELQSFMLHPSSPSTKFKNKFFDTVALPMYEAHGLWKSGSKQDAWQLLEDTGSNLDWIVAAKAWMERRLERAKAK